ncbi:hypothetical protein AAMO2058_001364100 [Amorphochlora amoebiformis]
MLVPRRVSYYRGGCSGHKYFNFTYQHNIDAMPIHNYNIYRNPFHDSTPFYPPLHCIIHFAQVKKRKYFRRLSNQPRAVFSNSEPNGIQALTRVMNFARFLPMKRPRESREDSGPPPCDRKPHPIFLSHRNKKSKKLGKIGADSTLGEKVGVLEASGFDSAKSSIAEMMRLVKARNQALKGRKSEAQTQASGPICDGDMIYGGPKLAEGLASRLLEAGLKAEIKYLSKNRRSWVLHCPRWCPLSKKEFQALWELHPSTFNEITMFGKRVQIPRWQQAYGQSYSFSGATAIANPNIPKVIKIVMDKANKLVGCFPFRMALVNWYSPEHYLGPHHDDTKQLVPNSPIISISWGQTRSFRIKRNTKRHCERASNTTIDLRGGDLLVMSW